VDISWTQDGDSRALAPDRLTTDEDLRALHDAVLVALADADTVVCDLTACHVELAATELADTLAGAATKVEDWPGAVVTVVAPQGDVQSQLAGRLPAPLPARSVRAARRVLEPVLRAPALGRAFLREILAGWPAGGHQDDALVVVDELVANAVLHAGTEVELRFALQDDRLGIAVADRAPARPSVGRPGESAESGRGLLLVDALARSWHVLPRRGGGKVIRAVLVASAAPVNG
jgi:anti-sigma regulatory factor (Ser/Thr protein kinase)